MPTISSDSNVLTLINTFRVDPDKRETLLKLLVDATENVMRHIDGFVSASFHESIDGKHLANYAQWQSKAHFDAMLADPEAQVHMKMAAQIADSFEPVLYQVAYCDER